MHYRPMPSPKMHPDMTLASHPIPDAPWHRSKLGSTTRLSTCGRAVFAGWQCPWYQFTYRRRLVGGESFR